MYAVTTYLPWLLSAITIIATILAGSKNKLAWSLSAANQVLWLIWILATQTWGFLPMNLILTVVFIRNHWLWSCNESKA